MRRFDLWFFLILLIFCHALFHKIIIIAQKYNRYIWDLKDAKLFITQLNTMCFSKRSKGLNNMEADRCCMNIYFVNSSSWINDSLIEANMLLGWILLKICTTGTPDIVTRTTFAISKSVSETNSLNLITNLSPYIDWSILCKKICVACCDTKYASFNYVVTKY